ncbi:hypothetical protein ACH5RR_000362 [Cinchona calisaya]|uniref:Flavin-containing monooxygenase n=1 Tax=Cinchona calisaya TaxID=153742 RepID=A0ABD3B0M8_9GENT
MNNIMAQHLKVAVIGAGVAGLVTAHELQREGHQVAIYEKSDQIGGVWVYNPHVEDDPLGIDPKRKIIHSSLYSLLRTNLPGDFMGFSDYPFTMRDKNVVTTLYQDWLKFQVVVVIGAGPSSQDISTETSKVAKEVYLSSRSPEIQPEKLEAYDNVWQHAKTEYCYENGEIAFKDGALVAADVIIHCTGY